MMKSVAALSLAALIAAGCTTTGNVEKRAAQGAAAGAIAGAIIGNNTGGGDAGDGAKTGAIIGAIGGAVQGRREDIASGEGTRLKERADGQELYYDETARRYYFFDERTGKTYWQDGSLRG